MRTALLVLTVAMLGTACLRRNDRASVSGSVHLAGNLGADSIYVGVYPLSNRHRLGTPHQYQAAPDGDFTFSLQPGQYVIAAFAGGYKAHREPLLVRDRAERIKIAFTLTPLTVPERITHVSVYGDFCQWDPKRAVPFNKTGDCWTLLDGPPLTPGASYLLRVNGTTVQDLDNTDAVPVKWCAGIHSRYAGGGIIFSPALYFTTPRESGAAVSGAALHDEYTMLVSRLDALEDSLWHFLRRSRTATPAEWAHVRSDALHALDGLEKWAPLPLRPLVQEKALDVTGRLHPAQYGLAAVLASGPADDEALRAYLLGDGYRSFFDAMLARLRALPPDSPVLQGTFQHDISRLRFWADKFPAVRAAYRSRLAELDELLLGFVDNAALPKLRRDLLVQTAVRYSRSGRPQVTRDLVARLKREFPDDRFVTNGGADRILRRLGLAPGNPAPDFTVTATDGSTISLADLRDAYVFISFWGTWCPPGRRELPNVSRLARTWPGGKVRVLGLAKDDPAALRTFLDKRPLPYPNAVANDTLLARYAISDYPATFLVGPDGNIVARDLQGKELVEIVRQRTAASF